MACPISPLVPPGGIGLDPPVRLEAPAQTKPTFEVTSVAEFLTDMTSPFWIYLVLIGLLAIDVFIPIVPTQALMITGGALTVYGGLSLPLTIVMGAFGVFTGDLAGYLLGRRGHRRRQARAGRRRVWNRARPPQLGRGKRAQNRTRPPQSGRSRRAQDRARQLASRYGHHLRQPGLLVVLLCRFVPGGRMLVCYQAGRGSYPYRRFLTYEAMAALGWAAYGGLVGHLGGSALAGDGWLLAGIAGLAAAVFAAGGWALALVAGRRQPAVTPMTTTASTATPMTTAAPLATAVSAVTPTPATTTAIPAAVAAEMTPAATAGAVTPVRAASAAGPPP
ncbi:DedA family protein [Micromonospora sp. NPDC003197]